MSFEPPRFESPPPDDRAALAHDIRQMLAVITGRAGLLLEKGGSDDPQDLEAILLAARDARLILDRWIAPPSGGPRDAGSAAYDVHKAVREAALLIRPESSGGWADEPAPPGAGSWALLNTVPEGLIVGLHGQVLREVCCNLILNALEAMPDGGTITFESRDEKQHHVLLVRDQGTGLDPALGDRIWESGVSGSGRPGRGLGLAGCRALLAKHGADIEIDRTVDTGAAFRLILPAGAVENLEPAIEAGIESGSKPMNVLVVEDETGVREMLDDVLTELGCRAVCFRDGEEALETFRPGTMDLAIIDQQLPGMQGAELAVGLKAKDTRLIVAVVTGWDNQAGTAENPPSEVDLRADKPLELSAIRDLLNQARRLQAENSHSVDKMQADEGLGKG